MLDAGVTTASVLLSMAFVGLLISKEVSVTHDGVDTRVKDSLNAALVPLAFGFLVIVLLQTVV